MIKICPNHVINIPTYSRGGINYYGGGGGGNGGGYGAPSGVYGRKTPSA